MKIYSASNPTQAHILCELLKSQTIRCEVRGEGIFGLQGELPISPDTDSYIWLLDQQQLDRAKTVIRDFESQSLQKDWHCPECGESNEAQFAICWQCGQHAPIENVVE
ncbi:DUF2007 domain-containing protein [Vibrio sonorensis]|uniref:putative signal transducing protein n=1 Tax=Vibrio sonorensis TaxID=1004316 RepID=UPI0008D9A986|nr:DUF2007 domain-containing protein [Vibrio sonorensis]